MRQTTYAEYLKRQLGDISQREVIEMQRQQIQTLQKLLTDARRNEARLLALLDDIAQEVAA